MSLYLNFEPHAWYMGFAIQKQTAEGVEYKWLAFTDDGNNYGVITQAGHTLEELRKQIRAYHLRQRNGYGERIAARRLSYLRKELRGERISYDELAELQTLVPFIASDDVELLEAAGVPEHE